MRMNFKGICDKYAKDKMFSGTCLIKKGNEVLFEGAYGYANRAFKIPNVINTRFDTASITKTFTAVATMQLVEKGLLSLEDNIVELIDLKGTKIPADVKIKHLLSHTSGIADDADEEAGEDYSALFIDSPNYAIRECKDFLKNFAYKEPNFKAGTAVRYNNCAFNLLGLAIEKLTGTSYRDYVTRHIFEACGMKNTKFCAMDEINENTAEGYKSIYDDKWNVIGLKKNIYSYPPIGTADSGAYTTVDDLDTFIQAIKNNELLSEEYSKEMFIPHCEFTSDSYWQRGEKTKVRMGYAFEFIEVDDELFCLYKDGQNDGVANRVSYYPKLDLTVAILSNQDCNIWAMNDEIQSEIYDQLYLNK